MPKGCRDLMEPQWKAIALTDPSRSGTAYMLVYGLLRQFGLDGLQAIAAHAIITGSPAPLQGRGHGAVPVGLTPSTRAGVVAGGQRRSSSSTRSRAPISRPRAW